MTYLPDQRINLGAPSLQIGRRGQFPQLPPELLAMAQGKTMQAQAAPSDNRARDYGVAEALANPASVESGGWGETVAEALASGLRGRMARTERQGALDTETRTRKQEDGQRMAVADALQNFDPANPSALIEGLRQQAPAQALDLATALAGREAGQEHWGEPYDMNGVTVQRADRSNQVRPVVTPNSTTVYQPPSGYRGTPEGLEPIPGGPGDPSRPGAPGQTLRGADARQLTRIQTTAESARGLRGLVDEFAANLENQDTFPGSGVQVWDAEVRNMSALAARMTGLMRPVGSGATSDFEQRIYARGAPSVDNTLEANRLIIEGIRKLGDIADARQMFYEEFAAQNGSLLGAEQAFQQSDDFRHLTNQAGGQQQQPSVTQQGPEGAPPPGISPDEWRVMTPEERALFGQ